MGCRQGAYCLADSIVAPPQTFIVKPTRAFPGSSDGKESACNAGDLGLIPVSRSFPGKGMATLSSMLARRIPRTDHRVSKSQTRLSN